MYPPASPAPRPGADGAAFGDGHPRDPYAGTVGGAYGYDGGGDAVAPPGPRPGSRPGRRRTSRRRRRIVALLLAVAVLAVPGVAGYEVGRDHAGSTSDSSTAIVPDPSGSAPAGDGSPPAPSDGSDPTSGSIDLAAVADGVDDTVVNVNTRVEGGGVAAGTGIVISSSGLVLTNSHVISGATQLTVELSATGATRSAKVLGYSVINDVAVIQVQNVTGLVAAELGDSSTLDIGETILALGNAGGTGGTPTVVSGTVSALEQEITASDSDGFNAQRLEGLIQLAADIRSGDSGGPVVDTDGTVVGMTVAASVANSFGFPGSAGRGEGYAIPIEDVIAIAERIISGEGGEGIRVGSTRALLGVGIQPTLTTQRTPGGAGSSTGSGAPVVSVEPGSGAEAAGIEAGDTITAVEGRTIATTNDLTRAMVAYDPGETITLTWRDANGRTQTGEVELGEGPPA